MQAREDDDICSFSVGSERSTRGASLGGRGDCIVWTTVATTTMGEVVEELWWAGLPTPGPGKMRTRAKATGAGPGLFIIGETRGSFSWRYDLSCQIFLLILILFQVDPSDKIYFFRSKLSIIKFIFSLLFIISVMDFSIGFSLNQFPSEYR